MSEHTAEKDAGTDEMGDRYLDRSVVLCRTCMRPLTWETRTEPGYLPRTGWYDDARSDPLVCFKAVNFRHVPLTAREWAYYEAGQRSVTPPEGPPPLSEPGTYRVKEVPTWHGRQDTPRSAAAVATSAETTADVPPSTPASPASPRPVRPTRAPRAGRWTRGLVGSVAREVVRVPPSRPSWGRRVRDVAEVEGLAEVLVTPMPPYGSVLLANRRVAEILARYLLASDWLAAHDAEVAARALREAADEWHERQVALFGEDRGYERAKAARWWLTARAAALRAQDAEGVGGGS